MLTQYNLASNVEAVDYSTEPGSVLLSVLPIHHAFCLVMDWLKGFSLGATVCINDSLMHMVRNMSIFKPDVMLFTKNSPVWMPLFPNWPWPRMYLAGT